MSTENKRICDIALSLFKKYKVEISDAINTTFPFLEYLRDHEFITSEMYKHSHQSLTKRHGVQEVIYDVLTELEKTFDLSILEALFSKVIMKKYPDLYNIYKIFKTAIPDLELSPECEMERRPDVQLSLEQGTVKKPLSSLTWLYQDPSDYNGTAPPENELAEPLRETQLKHENETLPTTSALKTQQANEQFFQESKPAVLSIDEDELTESSTGEQRSNPVISSDEDEPAKASTGEQRMNPGTVDLGNSFTLAKIKRKRRTIHRTNMSVNFHDELLPVTCGESSGMLIKRKLERGVTMKCIRSDDGNWFSLRELEIRGGYESASNWKNSLRCGGKSLRKLIMEGILPTPPRVYGRRRLEISEKCRICQDEGKLYCCVNCLGFFHGNCHLPPVESERNPWRCTFCTIQMGPKSQKCCKESEILGRPMGSEEMLKCDFVLLKVYHHLESNVFPNIPHENYVEQASRCLKKLRKLDEIKKNLIEGQYHQVEAFVRDMNHIFQDPRCNDSDLSEVEFKEHFKAVFAIQKPKLNSSLL
ncbi:nuclear body protein SP140-like protein [Molossus molossus]|uniref:SP140 nuclear body protein like n=1 Tax=Molossus molossus TaxID=27622 RepID=A0A7J8FUS4_MOLMO|nr:nuclear body protein SP140-like protein [Molossus molossus]KAF6451169.1 SP140 nuclear body protein like [Molossus molossus]